MCMNLAISNRLQSARDLGLVDFASSSEEIIQSTIAAVGSSDADFEQRLQGIFAARAVRRFEPITFDIPSVQIS